MIDGAYNLLGYYDTENLNLTWYNREQWMGNLLIPKLNVSHPGNICFDLLNCTQLNPLAGKVPQDRTIEKTVLRKVSLSLFISMSTVAGVGIVWAIVLILFTYIYRDRK